MTEGRRIQTSVRLTEQAHRRVKIFAISNGMSIQEYLLQLIKRDMAEHGEKVDDIE